MRKVPGACSPLDLGACAFLIVAVGGCAPPGGQINISGLPIDIITVQRIEPIHGGVCCHPFPIGECFGFRVLQLDRSGFGVAAEMVDELRYTGFSEFSGCWGFAFVPCSGVGNMDCAVTPAPTPTGRFVIVGSGVGCKKIFDEEGWLIVCNTTTISANIDGDQVSVTAQKGSTASSVALALSNAINAHPTIRTKVVAAAFSNEVHVRAWQEGVQYSYPWYTTCSYAQDFFSGCAFEAQRSPISTLAPQ